MPIFILCQKLFFIGMFSKESSRVKAFLFTILASTLLVAVSPQLPQGLALLAIGFLIIIIFNFFALAENNLSKYAAFCFIVQLGYVVLDIGIAVASGKAPYLAGIQAANFFFAGSLFLASIKGKDFNNLKTNNYSLIGIAVSAMALAGLPGFNLFVGEYFLYILAFDLNPVILGICFLCSLLTLFACLKIVSHAFSQGIQEKPSAFLKLKIIPLSAICIILGIIPWIQIMIFEAII